MLLTSSQKKKKKKNLDTKYRLSLTTLRCNLVKLKRFKGQYGLEFYLEYPFYVCFEEDVFKSVAVVSN